MEPDKPLAGRRIVITRPLDQAGDDAERIAALGGEPVVWPLIAIEPTDRPEALDAALRELDAFDWVALTSANAARAVLERLAASGLGPAALARTRVACVGERTAAAARAAGLRVDLVPPRADGRSLAAALAAGARGGERVLLPRSDLAAPDLPEALRRAGLVPVEVVAYRTVPAEVPPADPILQELLAGRLDALLLASGSAAAALAAALGNRRSGWAARTAPGCRPLVACIGRATAAAARRHGLPVDVVPQRAEGGALVEAVADRLGDDGSGGMGPC